MQDSQDLTLELASSVMGSEVGFAILLRRCSIPPVEAIKGAGEKGQRSARSFITYLGGMIQQIFILELERGACQGRRTSYRGASQGEFNLDQRGTPGLRVLSRLSPYDFRLVVIDGMLQFEEVESFFQTRGFVAIPAVPIYLRQLCLRQGTFA